MLNAVVRRAARPRTVSVLSERLDRGDECRAFAKERDLLGRGLLHLHHEVGAEGGGLIGDGRAGRAVRLVGMPAAGARTGSDDDLGPGLRELGDRLRHERDAPLAGHGLSRHSDLHLVTES